MDDPGSKQFITQISTTFFTNAEQVFQKIEAAFSEKSIEAIAKYAHQLKSSSGNVAAKRLSDLFKKLETVAKQGDFQEAEELWKPIGEEYHLVEMAYEKILKD
jgi:HPt (histidine-containing phosphotransfer) domain-containing protein